MLRITEHKNGFSNVNAYAKCQVKAMVGRTLLVLSKVHDQVFYKNKILKNRYSNNNIILSR